MILTYKFASKTMEKDLIQFDTKSNKKFSGFGIVGMKERAELIGGKVVIISKPNKGTEVICTIPV